MVTLTIRSRLVLAFLLVLSAVLIISFYATRAYEQTFKVHAVELPMEQELREVEVSLWETIYAADGFRLTAFAEYQVLYDKQVDDVNQFFNAYKGKATRSAEKQFVAEFESQWDEILLLGDDLFTQTQKQKELETELFQTIDQLDDIIDFSIQQKWTSETTDLLEKERAVREVEVSLWEMIHAAQQSLGLSAKATPMSAEVATDQLGNLGNPFVELMEKQIGEIEFFWSKFRRMTPSSDVTQMFENNWIKAKELSRELVIVNQVLDQNFNRFGNMVHLLDDHIDFKMQVELASRIEERKDKAEVIEESIILVGLAGVLILAIFLFFLMCEMLTKIKHIKETSVALGEGKLERRVAQEKTVDELDVLGATLNLMAAQLQEALNVAKLETQKSENIITSNSEPVFVTNSTGQIHKLSTVALQTFFTGRAPEQVELIVELADFLPVEVVTFLLGPEQGQKSQHIEANLTLEGIEKTFLFSSRLIKTEQELELGFVVSAVDISQQKYRELQLEQAKIEAERLAKAKTSFLANMSHEIRTPMNSVMGFLRLLQRSHLAYDDTQKVDLALTSAEDMLTIISDVLDYSKADSGMLTLELTTFDLPELIELITQSWSQVASEKELAVTGDLENCGIQFVKGDPTRIRQVLNNLLANAVKFTAHGEVRLKVKATKSGAGRVALKGTVEDTGIGIKQEDLTRIFESFSQGDTSTTRKFGGTGLGLSIVKEICQLMHGDVFVHSQVGAGSCFHFSMLLDEPCEKEVIRYLAKQASHLDGNVTAQHTFKGIRVISADDIKINHVVIQNFLKSLGITEYVSVTDGCEVLEALQLNQGKNKFDLILMDCHMPNLDGYEASKKIRQGKAGEQYIQTPIIALTANASQEDKRNCLDAGMTDYLCKPIDFVLFEQVVYQVLSGSFAEQKVMGNL